MTIHLLKKPTIRFIILLILAVLCKLAQLFPPLIEHYYIPYIHQPFGLVLRWLFGWIPFSVGDIIYTILIILLIRFFYKNSRKLKKIRSYNVKTVMLKVVSILLSIYVIYSLLWGIQYNRLGIAHQLQFKNTPVPKSAIVQLMKNYADSIITIGSSIHTDDSFQLNIVKKDIVAAYQNASAHYPFLNYKNRSVKPSLYGKIMNLMGLQGYYNPLTTEAQFNNTIPAFLKPNVFMHEMAHQLSYAKEDEANFVGYLASMHTSNPYIKYSFYMDVFLYTLPEVKSADSIAFKQIMQTLPTVAKNHIKEWIVFRKKHRSVIEKITQWVYNQFLTINDRSSGIYSYNEVLQLLIHFEEKKKTNPSIVF